MPQGRSTDGSGRWELLSSACFHPAWAEQHPRDRDTRVPVHSCPSAAIQRPSRQTAQEHHLLTVNIHVQGDSGILFTFISLPSLLKMLPVGPSNLLLS